MKLLLCSFLIVTFFSQTSFAKRWIVENPKNLSALNTLSGIQSQQTITFGTKTFLALELKDSRAVTAMSIQMTLGSGKVYEDLKIELVDSATEEPAVANEGWHVDALKYDKLNPDFDGTGVTVAVLDTGVNYEHTALKSNMWMNKNEIKNNNIDDDNNGFVDDYYGYDFIDKDSDPNDIAGHGTHCSGLIVADQRSGGKSRGIAPGAKIMALRIIGNDQKGLLSATAIAIKYAVDNGAKVLSNSWRIYKSWANYYNEDGIELLKVAIKYAEDNGVIFVAAAGNETLNLDQEIVDPIFPLSLKGFSNVVGVSSSSFDPAKEIISNFSNYGANTIAVVAPGADIMSTHLGNTWKSLSGTSMATPIVSGAIARGLSKGYKALEAINELQKTSDKSNYWQKYVIHGRIEVQKYLE